MQQTNVAIIGSGNIGTDLMFKIMRYGKALRMAAMVGVDPGSEGLSRASRLGLFATASGLDGLRGWEGYRDIGVVFDATSARAHEHHAAVLKADGKLTIDLTPAAIGPYVIPPVNLDNVILEENVNMVTCGGQATIPMVAAVRRIARVPYAEIVASIASLSAGPGTRANIDEFTETTARAIEKVGGADRGKAIIILNPAEPPLIMRDTVYCLVESNDFEAIRASVHEMAARVQSYVPGYRLKQDIQFEPVANFPGSRAHNLTKVTILLEVEGAGHYLPAYAGNLDIMTSAALATAERLVSKKTLEQVA
ncbi:acetaldehyde dehydrogenase (acetylating) [Bradyrhizobium tropiciagri]|uniref:acetaldehyde dehydrogenase (acetylating) n=1 Tax=Bradyrhizobium tropiciagri TaxID=312253 RepID=UPI001BAE14B8|nr:acetaldehyde dehydrogenase (acetylating) [Bradyrhizobium tropiciagri]MBR0899052.1 acetaldehyde dehydrogenase (acetylating) [Bradyrhizobium tropiciagri]